MKSFLIRAIARKELVGIFQKVSIQGADGRWHTFLAKIDTGAFRTCLDIGLGRKLGLLESGGIGKVVVGNVHGKKTRELCKVKMKIKSKVIMSEMSLFDRSKMRYAMIIGRLDLDHFVIETNPDGSRSERYWKDVESID